MLGAAPHDVIADRLNGTATVSLAAISAGIPLVGLKLTSEGDRGCMFLKALGEYGARAPAIAEVAVSHKRRVLDNLSRRVGTAGLEASDGLPEKLMLLMEGATALAPVLGPEEAADQARAAAADLLTAARRRVAR